MKMEEVGEPSTSHPQPLDGTSQTTQALLVTPGRLIRSLESALPSPDPPVVQKRRLSHRCSAVAWDES